MNMKHVGATISHSKDDQDIQKSHLPLEAYLVQKPCLERNFSLNLPPETETKHSIELMKK